MAEQDKAKEKAREAAEKKLTPLVARLREEYPNEYQLESVERFLRWAEMEEMNPEELESNLRETGYLFLQWNDGVRKDAPSF